MPLAISIAAALLVSTTPASPAATLTFDRLYVNGPAGARVAPEVEALAGQTVRLVGHMAQMEEPSPGAFYLAPRPVDADESGGGTGDLPPRSVRVEVPGRDELPWIRGPVEVEGRLEVGRLEDAEGRVSYLRIVVKVPSNPPGGHP